MEKQSSMATVRNTIAILLLLVCYLGNAQTVHHDTIFKTPVGVFVYSMDMKVPIMVSYDLGTVKGGDCSRKGMSFKEFNFTATNADYLHSGFDKGHCIPAEDFAYDCELEKLTFTMYNVIPQVPNLNRGSWAIYEAKIRLIAEPVRVIIVNKFTDRKMGEGVHIPIYSYKVVQSVKTKKLLYCLKFTDSDVVEVTLTEVQTISTHKLPILR